MSWNVQGLLERPEKVYEKTKNEYIELLFDDRHEEALEKLNKMDLIKTHINRVEEL